MAYGYFDDTQREYVITSPKTPVKWINYIGTLEFGGIVDHTGGALICRRDPSLNRITKYLPQSPNSDFKGETLYLRVHTPGGYRIFSPYYTPTLDPYDRYECRVGLGYTRIISEFYGIRTQVTIFVPTDDTRVIRDIQITNLTNVPLEIDAIPVVEYSHFDALKQFTNADWVPQTMQSKAAGIEGHTVLVQYAFMNRDRQINYFTVDQPVSSFDSDRKVFLGNNEYGSWAKPLTLLQPELCNSQALRGDNVAALMIHLGRIAPQETRRFVTQLGQAASLDEALPSIRRYWDAAEADAAFESLARFWEDYLAAIQIETPDPSLNSMLNIHNPRQCHTTKNWSRYLSLYQLGLGSRGIGMRDSSQDVMGVMAHMPAEAKELIVKLLSIQRPNGSANHLFYPLTMEASEGDALEMGDRPHYYSDDHLWIILAVCAYLKETGDVAFLDETVPYYDKKAPDSGTVRDHLRRAIDFTRWDVGTHGLPLAGYADWNDTINLRTGAESLFTANLYGKALLELIELAEFEGDRDAAEYFTTCYDEMKARVNEHGWDGRWYRRYYDVDGQPLGSQQNIFGQVFTNGQSWPVISGFAPDDRARHALDTVYERLNTRHGIKLSTPGFNGYDPAVGGASTYPPGAKENGGIFLHANPWVVIAETLLGNGERAYQYYSQINPAAKNDLIEVYECEPYVYAQNILGDEHPQFGLARNSWLSGTASWMYQAGTQYILGIQPTYNGLRIDPCIPKDWGQFTVTRRYRNVIYSVVVRNPDRVNRGVRSVRVDGEPIVGNVVPIFTDGTHSVEVILGR